MAPPANDVPHAHDSHLRLSANALKPPHEWPLTTNLISPLPVPSLTTLVGTITLCAYLASLALSLCRDFFQ